ncbi:MAG TPA: YdeI/OmpD-associated family protein [Thermoanaerobaculia bacterium]|nr:YdeI/OmpD-associated family protein [Thermoanaerobaculia bacterium]
MPKKDPRMDAYIAKSPEYARPILKHLRAIVHEGCPEVEETMKWSMPHFDYKGPLAGMAAFKAHCAFGFWKAPLVVPGTGEAMGQFGRITKVGDLPKDKVLLGYVKKAVKLNDEGVKVPRAVKPQKEIPMPADLAGALKKNAKARAAFEGFPPSHKREYLAWITGAKADETRARRLGTAIEWMSEGKSLHWRYQR